MGKNSNFHFGLEFPKESFGIQNKILLNTFGNRNTSVSSSLAFEACSTLAFSKKSRNATEDTQKVQNTIPKHPRNATQDTQKWCKIPSESTPSDYLGAEKRSDTGGGAPMAHSVDTRTRQHKPAYEVDKQASKKHKSNNTKKKKE